jgi:hypothetical protein
LLAKGRPPDVKNRAGSVIRCADGSLPSQLKLKYIASSMT